MNSQRTSPTPHPPATVSVMIPALNEERNIEAAIRSVSWADEVVIIDSGSTDRTVAVSDALGARIERFSYDGQIRKKAWAFSSLSFTGEWVLFLDADERCTPALEREIADAISSAPPDVGGFYVDREMWFMGKKLKSFQPDWNLRLFRAGQASMEDLGLSDLPESGDNEVHEHVTVEGETGFLRSPLLHEDRKPIRVWMDRHIRYAEWEAHLALALEAEPMHVRRLFSPNRLERKRTMRRLWQRVPFRPLARVLLWLFPRGGWRDGRMGWTYALLMGWYQMVIELRKAELARESRGTAKPHDG